MGRLCRLRNARVAAGRLQAPRPRFCSAAAAGSRPTQITADARGDLWFAAARRRHVEPRAPHPRRARHHVSTAQQRFHQRPRGGAGRVGCGSRATTGQASVISCRTAEAGSSVGMPPAAQPAGWSRGQSLGDRAFARTRLDAPIESAASRRTSGPDRKSVAVEMDDKERCGRTLASHGTRERRQVLLPCRRSRGEPAPISVLGAPAGVFGVPRLARAALHRRQGLATGGAGC